MKQQIKLNKINFSRASKTLTKLLKENLPTIKNNQVSELLAKSFGFNSYHHAEKEDFKQNTNEKDLFYVGIFEFVCGREKTTKIYQFKNNPNFMDLWTCVEDKLSIELKSNEANEKFEAMIENLVNSNLILRSDKLNFITIGELISEYLYSDELHKLSQSHPDFFKELEEIILLEIENNDGVDLISYLEEVYTLKSYKVEKITNEEMEVLKKCKLI